MLEMAERRTNDFRKFSYIVDERKYTDISTGHEFFTIIIKCKFLLPNDEGEYIIAEDESKTM